MNRRRNDSMSARSSRRVGKTGYRNMVKRSADEVYISTAVLALVASIADGDPDRREIECLFERFKFRFALTSRGARRYVTSALARVRGNDPIGAFETACERLVEHLDLDQRLNLMDDLADIIISDNRVDRLEECFLDDVAMRLGLVSVLSPAA